MKDFNEARDKLLDAGARAMKRLGKPHPMGDAVLGVLIAGGLNAPSLLLPTVMTAWELGYIQASKDAEAKLAKLNEKLDKETT